MRWQRVLRHRHVTRAGGDVSSGTGTTLTCTQKMRAGPVHNLIFHVRGVFKRREGRRRNASADGTHARVTTVAPPVSIVVGILIGSGIFIVSAESVRLVGATGWLLVVWALAGLMTITLACCL